MSVSSTTGLQFGFHFALFPVSGLTCGNRQLAVILGALHVFLVDPTQSSDLFRHELFSLKKERQIKSAPPYQKNKNKTEIISLNLTDVTCEIGHIIS